MYRNVLRAFQYYLPEAEMKFLKWLDNFWYHHKWKTIISLFLIVVLTVCIAQLVEKEDYDACVMYVGAATNGIPKSIEARLEELMGGEKYNVNFSRLTYDPDIVIWFYTEDRRIHPYECVKQMLEKGVDMDEVQDLCVIFLENGGRKYVPKWYSKKKTLEEALKANKPADEIKKLSEDLQQTMYAISSAAYSQVQQEEQQAQGGAENNQQQAGGSSNNSDDDVIDAEYTKE